jgi:hypothetical protein
VPDERNLISKGAYDWPAERYYSEKVSVENLDSLDDESTTYAAEPGTETSHAITVTEPDGRFPAFASCQGWLRYFLEVSITCYFLDGWTTNLAQPPSLQEKCARLIKYASYDS